MKSNPDRFQAMSKRDIERTFKRFINVSLPWDPNKEPWRSNSAEENKESNEPVQLYDAFNVPNSLGLWKELRFRPNLLKKVLQNQSTVRREAERYNQLQEEIEARIQNGFGFFFWDLDEPPNNLETSHQTRIIPYDLQKNVLLNRCNQLRDFLEFERGYDLHNLSNDSNGLAECTC